MTKKEIRQNMILQRNQLSKETVQENSNSIIENLQPYVQKAENIMIFMNMRSEVEITRLIELYPDKKFQMKIHNIQIYVKLAHFYCKD